MISRECRAPGCDALRTRYGAYCSTHKTRKRRHGGPDQRGITKADLKPYLAIISERIEKNEGLAIWTQLDERWLNLVEHVKDVRRTTVLGPVKRAADEIDKLANDVKARDIVKTVLATYLMRDNEPHRFHGDTAFNTQLVRRVRALSLRNTTASVSRQSGRRSRVYTELTPRITAAMATWVISALGMAGVWIARKETEERKAKQKERDRLGEGLKEIDFG